MSSDRITEIKEKQDLLISYLQKVADSTSLINQITTPAIVNMFTSSMLSPTTAALTYNKISVASQNALSKALSVIDSILEPQRKMAVLFEQKGELLKQFKNNSPYGKALETNLTENLIRNGFNAEQIQTIVSTI